MTGCEVGKYPKKANKAMHKSQLLQEKQDKYTMDPGQSNLSQQSDNNFSKKGFLKKIIKKHINYA